jgi:hypothetical protein
MLSSHSVSRRVGLAVIGAAVVVSVAACGSNSATAKPSLLDSFSTKITSADFQASGTLTGSYKMTVAGTDFTATISGTDKIHGKDSDMSMKLDMAATSATPASSSVNDSIEVGGFVYTRTDGGAWSKSEKASGATITTVIAQVGLADKGVESHFNQQLHRLESTKTVPASLMFSDTTGITNPVVTLVFWAKDDGTPAGMTMSATYTQTSSGTSGDVTMSLDVSFDSLSGVTIVAPSV